MPRRPAEATICTLIERDTHTLLRQYQRLIGCSTLSAAVQSLLDKVGEQPISSLLPAAQRPPAVAAEVCEG